MFPLNLDIIHFSNYFNMNYGVEPEVAEYCANKHLGLQVRLHCTMVCSYSSQCVIVEKRVNEATTFCAAVRSSPSALARFLAHWLSCIAEA